jgi:hypothetical protein
MSISLNMVNGDYEAALAEHMRDVPMGISSSMAEDCFHEQWEIEHGLRPAPVKEKVQQLYHMLFTEEK